MKYVEGLRIPSFFQVRVAPFAAAAIVVALSLSFPNRAHAQTTFWDNIIGFNQTPTTRPPRKSRTSRPPDDLRKGDIPWRSDEMLDALHKAIARYEKLVSIGGWPNVPKGRMMREGDPDDRVPVLRRRLRISGDLSPKRSSFEGYDFGPRLRKAVERFQRRHGLRVTGRVQRATYAALNVTAEKRLQQLRLNERRLRDLLNQPMESRYVLVNVPAYQLEAVENYTVQRRHRVIVGRPGRDTPDLKATIKALNFFPYWKVPNSVAISDLIPRLQKDPDFLRQENITVLADHYEGEPIDISAVDWTNPNLDKIKFRQDPGPKNALGLVRLDMANEHGVYMHDTPMKKLFHRRGRAFSAGCVRVQGVFKLAEWIASKEIGWEQRGRARSVVDSGEALTLELTRPVPVYFSYISAWGEMDGTVRFRPDIYDKDGGREFVGEADPDLPPPPPNFSP